MINFAHRGASGDYPENTLLAFKEGIKAGANGLELDVHKTKDGKLVVIHDEDVERTFQARGLVKDLTLDELRALTCRKQLFKDSKECRVPTLEEVLELVKKHPVTLNIELKTDVIPYNRIEEDVIRLPIDQVIQYAKSLQADAIHPDLKLVSEALIKEAHENQLEVNIYTVNSPIYMRKLIAAGADGIFTDYPALLNEIMEEEM